jgi:hypothetical protein
MKLNFKIVKSEIEREKQLTKVKNMFERIAKKTKLQFTNDPSTSNIKISFLTNNNENLHHLNNDI